MPFFEGYTSSSSVRQGDEIALHIRRGTPIRRVVIQVTRDVDDAIESGSTSDVGLSPS